MLVISNMEHKYILIGFLYMLQFNVRVWIMLNPKVTTVPVDTAYVEGYLTFLAGTIMLKINGVTEDIYELPFWHPLSNLTGKGMSVRNVSPCSTPFRVWRRYLWVDPS
jgi:hypothetical protein